MIKRSSFIVAILLIVCLSISSVSATALDNNSGDAILNSEEITTDDINNLNDCNVASNLESEGSSGSDVGDSSTDLELDDSSDSNLDLDSDDSSDSIGSVGDNQSSNIGDNSVNSLSNSESNAVSESNDGAKESSLSKENLLNAYGFSSSDFEILDDVSVSDNLKSYGSNPSDVDEKSSIGSVSNVDSNSISSNHDTANENSVSVSIPHDEDINKGGMSDNLSQSNVASSDDVNEPVMIASNDVVNSTDVSNVKSTESTSLSTSNLTSGSTASPTVSMADIITGSITLKQYVLKYNKLPTYVKVNGVSYSISQFSYLMSEAIKNIAASKKSNIKVIKIANASYTNYSINKTATKSVYLNLAKLVASKGVANKAVPSYVTLDGKKADFRVYTYAFAKILTFYNTKNRLPSTCIFDSSVFKTTPKANYVSINDIVKAAKTVKSNVNTKKDLPTTVAVGNYNVSISQFSYLMAQAIKHINAKDKSDIKIINVNKSVSTIGSINQKVDKDVYLKSVNTVVSSGLKHAVPKYVTVDGKKAYFKVYTYAYAKILDFYNTKNRLPNTCIFESSVFEKTPTPSKDYVSISQIATASKKVKSFVINNQRLPNTVTVGTKTLTIAQFTYVLSEAVKYISAGKASTNIKVINVTKPSYKGEYISKTIDSSAVLKLAKNISSTCKANNKAPNYVLIGGKKAGFDDYTYMLVKDLAFYKDKGRLANKVTVSSSVFTDDPGKYQKGINEKNTETDLTAYLKASGHCALNSQIKKLAASLTKNCNTTAQKAKAIYNYVRDQITYSYYANSQKSASGALSTKKANCCDKSNLIVALCRAVKIPARYCHAKCHFSSGLYTGHVWAQILVGDTWYAADATSTRNSLGHINNWDTSRMTGLSQYSSLPF